MMLGLDKLLMFGVFKIDFPSGNVEHAIVKPLVENGHFAFDEFAVLVDGIAGEIDSFFEICLDKFK